MFTCLGAPAQACPGGHHDDLRRVLLDSALEVVADSGPATLSLREVARRAGVSQAAPTHHFGDKTGLMTAMAAEGWARLADALAATAARTGDFTELGVWDLLRHGAAYAGAPAERARVLAGWALVHGLATLLEEGNVGPSPAEDIATLARFVTRQLPRPRSSAASDRAGRHADDRVGRDHG